MKENLNTIPIFFTVDDKYVPFLAVALQSLIENSSEKNYYLIKILYTSITEENQEKIKKYEKENVNIEFVDLNYYINKIKHCQQINGYVITTKRLDNPLFIIYNIFVTRFECDVKFDFSDYDIGLSNKVGFFP